MKSIFLLLAVIILCFGLSTPLRRVSAADCTRTSMSLVPLNDLGTGTYSGAQGGLYPNGSNVRSSAHESAGIEQSLSVRPLDAAGQPSPTGKIVLLSIGMSNSTQEFSAFKQIADVDPRKNPQMVIVDGAQGGNGADFWTDPNAPTWGVVADRLAASGVTEQQIQTLWIKQQFNSDAIPNFPADAERLRDALRQIVLNAKAKYPNLRLIYLTSRSYGGYNGDYRGTGAYRSGFAVKWLIEDQINGDPRLAYTGSNPPAAWLSWGPYIYADGMNPRSDGLTYACSDFVSDGTHPSTAGRGKIAGLLMDFFKSDSTARLWFLAAQHKFADFDGDGRADISVFRPTDRIWYLQQSTSGFAGIQFGLPTDKIAPADFDGDGKTDISVFREGLWYWLDSSDGSFHVAPFGITGDIPVPADYDGDGRSELAVYRGGIWYLFNLASNQVQIVQFGIANDKTVPADYDGDGKTDFAVYRDGIWYVLQSLKGSAVVQFGIATDQPTIGDYDGDGKADPAVFRDGVWYILGSTRGFFVSQFGIAGDIPAAADYDGDGKTDIAVYRDGLWYLMGSQQGFAFAQFGLAGDKPVPAAFAP